MKAAHNRFQVDLTDDQLTTLEGLTRITGLRTKRELFENAIALFQWAARERMQGRSICSVNIDTQALREFEMPALAACAGSFDPPALTAAELERRRREPGRPLREVLEELTKE